MNWTAPSRQVAGLLFQKNLQNLFCVNEMGREEREWGVVSGKEWQILLISSKMVAKSSAGGGRLRLWGGKCSGAVLVWIRCRYFYPVQGCLGSSHIRRQLWQTRMTWDQNQAVIWPVLGLQRMRGVCGTDCIMHRRPVHCSYIHKRGRINHFSFCCLVLQTVQPIPEHNYWKE